MLHRMFTCKIEAGFRVFIFIILPFVLTNCIREDMSGCPRDDGGLALKFSYDTNADSRYRSVGCFHIR